MALLDTLKRLKVLRGRGKQSDLLRLCHAGRLVGGLSISLRATPDEVVGPLTHALGGTATTLRVVDVRSGPPMVVDVKIEAAHEADDGSRVEKWELVDVAALVHNLNDLYRDDASVKRAVVLGEWDDMLQVFCVEKAAFEQLARYV